jgi:ABC-type Zn uptake system ZnuABC Zn-binding protein ZnuA
VQTSRRLAAIALAVCLVTGATALASCGEERGEGGSTQPVDVVATTSWLADIAQNVAGDRLTVESVVPLDADPHAFEPTPSDLTEVATSDLLIVNGGGLEAQLLDMLEDAGGDVETVVASAGLTPRTPGPLEPAHEHEGAESDSGSSEEHADAETDAHFWLDPISVVTYVENIRDALIAADPDGADVYRANADAYVKELEALDAEIREMVETIPPESRKLVMNHASHGYFADRYGLEVVGAVIPAFSTGATPTARELADLVATIDETGVRAIFVGAAENPQLAEQIGAETGVTVETRLLDHSLTGPTGVAPTYLDMLRYDAALIVEALRP